MIFVEDGSSPYNDSVVQQVLRQIFIDTRVISHCFPTTCLITRLISLRETSGFENSIRIRLALLCIQKTAFFACSYSYLFPPWKGLWRTTGHMQGICGTFYGVITPPNGNFLS
ncbi:hypothetical protein TNCT_268681 [Trichonephila clavata]|uniref:Uncharacterized protein n=1 Tax=Trichonephila clavata TaxID=2740835 RepID=A0A8X6I013_TRICU|nr:hypothetical protein TNCT_268681 [Trichonephila clavata]